MKVHDYEWLIHRAAFDEPLRQQLLFAESLGLRFCVDFGVENVLAAIDQKTAQATVRVQ